MRSIYVDIRHAALPSGDLRVTTVGFGFERGVAVELRSDRIWAPDSVVECGVEPIVLATRSDAVKELILKLIEALDEK